MKDAHDKVTGDLLVALTPKQRWAQRQREKGLKQRGLWVTDAEMEAIERLLEQLRGADVPQDD